MSSGSDHSLLMSRMLAFELVCTFEAEEVRLGVSMAISNLQSALASRGICNSPADFTFFDQVQSGIVPTSEVVPYVMSRAEHA